MCKEEEKNSAGLTTNSQYRPEARNELIGPTSHSEHSVYTVSMSVNRDQLGEHVTRDRKAESSTFDDLS